MPSSESQASDAFRRIGERGRFKGKFFGVVTGTFVGPDGFMFEREIVRHPGAVCAVPLEDDGRHVIMVRQYRGAVEEPVLELPAGKRDVAEEDPAVCVARELVEEIGREAGRLSEVARFYNSPGFTDEETICYLAEDLRQVEREAHGIEEEHLVVERIDLSELEDFVFSGRLIDAKSIIGLFAARAAISRRTPGA